MGKYEEAEPLYRRALAGQEAALGAEHPSTLISVTNLGILLRKRNDFASAEPLLRRAMQGFRSALGEVHQLSVCSTMALALLLAQTHRDAEAASLYEPVEELGPQMPETLKDVRELASLLEGRGDEGAAQAAALRRRFGV